MKYPHYLLISIFLLFSLCLQAQTEGIEEHQFKKLIICIQKNTDSSFYFIDKLKKSKNQCRVLFTKVLEANLYYNKNNYELSENILESVLQEIETNLKPQTFTYSKLMVGKTFKACIETIKLNIYRRYFYIRKNQNKLLEAYNYLLLAKNIVNNLQEKNTYYIKNKISILYSMASLKKVLNNKEESLKILLELNEEIDSINIDKKNIWYHNFLNEKANINIQIGRNYMHLEKTNPNLYGLADLYYDKALEITQKIEGNSQQNKTSHFLRKAELNVFRKKYKKALAACNKVLGFYKKNKYNRAAFKIKATCFSKLNQPDSAIFFSNKILVNDTKNNLTYNYLELNNILSKNYYKLHLLDSAYKYSNLTLKAYEEQNTQLKKLTSIFDSEKLKSAVLLNSTIKKEKNKFRNISLTAIIMAIIILVVLVLYNFKRRKVDTQKIESFQEQIKKLENVNPVTKNNKNSIDDETVEKVLFGLKDIEKTVIFLDKDFNLNTLAKILKTNTSYLSRIINEHKNISFKQYLIGLRITHLIKELDKKPILRKHSIQAIAESVGYSNASSFTRIFKNYTGKSPSVFLKERYAK